MNPESDIQMSIKSYIYSIKKELVDFFKLFLPKGKTETILCIVLSIIYLSYSFILIFQTSIIDHPTIETDLYFSFDNPLILRQGRTQITGHPLIFLFYYPLVLIGNGLATLLGYKAKTIFFVILCSFLISMSSVYIYRYIKEIVEIKSNIALFITLFFSFFSTNLILSFTPESFTLSLFFLSFNIYYYSSFIKKNILPPLVPTIILSSVMLGGVTITNFVKGIIPVLFVKNKIFIVVKRGVILGIIFIAILCIIHLISYYALSKDFIGSIFVHQGRYTAGIMSAGELFEKFFYHFFGGPIFFPNLTNGVLYNASRQYLGTMITEGGYDRWWQTLFVSILFITILLSVLKNYKKRLVWVIIGLLSVDIVIHVVFRFGITTPFLYGGHWVYCVPLLLGWLYKSLHERYNIVFLILLGALFLGLTVNNVTKLNDFIRMAIELYPAV